jgi:uncharacterized peroxidase-related enzyme
MTDFTLHTAQTALPEAAAKLAQIEKAWQFVPNLHRILATSPETLEGYDTLFGLVGKTTLTPAEQQVVFLTVNYENECEYCMAGHSVLAKMAKVPADAIAALRENAKLADARLQALHAFAQAVVRERGRVGDAAVAAFLAAGFTKRNVLEVVLVVATKTISNYVNHIAHTPNDAFMADTAWTAPSRRTTA